MELINAIIQVVERGKRSLIAVGGGVIKICLLLQNLIWLSIYSFIYFFIFFIVCRCVLKVVGFFLPTWEHNKAFSVETLLLDSLKLFSRRRG